MGLQAGSPLPETVAAVRGLMDHPAFDIKNSNRVRALIGAFSVNHLRFHNERRLRLSAGGRGDPHSGPNKSASRGPHGGRL